MYSSSSSINMSQERMFKKMILSETSDRNATVSISTDAYDKSFSDIVNKLNHKSNMSGGGKQSILDSATSSFAVSTAARNKALNSETSNEEGVGICE